MLNVNLFTGDVFVTDFSDIPAFGNIATDRLDGCLIAGVLTGRTRSSLSLSGSKLLWAQSACERHVLP